MSIPFLDNLDLNNNKIINVANPENDKDLVNKVTMDTAISNLETTLNNNILIAETNINNSVDNKIEILKDTIDNNIATMETELNNNIDNKILAYDSSVSVKIGSAILSNIVNDLQTTDTEKSLSANMGKELKDLVDTKVDVNNVYTKSETDDLLLAKADTSNVYSKSETYTKTETDNLLNNKADLSNIYTKDEIDAITTSSTFTFTDISNGGTVDVILKRIGKIVYVYVYPTLAVHADSINIMVQQINLPDWAKISETSNNRYIVLCSNFDTSGFSSSTDSAGNIIINVNSIYEFRLYKRTDGNYYFVFLYKQKDSVSSITRLISNNASYLIY